MSENGKLMPNLDEKSRKTLNLTVLQRLDPYIDQILITAAHVTFYQFNVHLNQWSRKDVEGSLFVVKRNAQPRFQFIVMNRRNTENLVEDLLGDFDYELQVPYLLYRNAAHEVNGIWFYNPRECEGVANLFTRLYFLILKILNSVCTSIFSRYLKFEPLPTRFSQKFSDRIHVIYAFTCLVFKRSSYLESILGAYSKVAPQPKVKKSAFEELEAVPTSAVIERPLEPSFTTSSSKDVPEDSSYANFFGTAMKLGHHASSNSANSQQPYHNSTPTHVHSRVASSPALNNPSLHIPLYTSPGMALHDTPDPLNSNNRVTNLIKPLSFFTPSSSASPLMPQPSPSVPGAPLQPPRNPQHNHGIPLLQPFPPPTPPSSLTPGPNSSPNNGALSRGQVRDALLMLAQDNQFIDMFHQALLKVLHQ